MKFKKFIALICTFAFMLPNLLNVYAGPTDQDVEDARQFLINHGYTEVKHCGSGGFSAVFKCKNSNDQPVAVKVVCTNDSDQIQREIDGAEAIEALKPSYLRPRDELGLNLILGHYVKYYYKYLNVPTVIKLDDRILIESRLANGDAFDLITNDVCGGTISCQMLKKIFKAVLKALSVLHSKGIVHHDVKAENILITFNADGSVSYSLTDFGLSGKFNGPKFSGGGTPAYAAPELFQDSLTREQIFKTDVYSLSATMYQMYLARSGQLRAARPRNLQTSIDRLQSSDTAHLNASTRDFLDLIKWCTKRDPSQRPTAQAALNHAFLQ
ncbi:MAG: protein kinase [Oscillospiraceae bacterium]|jgi:serine/threonine protein kinase|nr:protein kinase [Oscillospiraceae bacterium]